MLKRLLFVSAMLLPVSAHALDQTNSIIVANMALEACMEQNHSAKFCGCYATAVAGKTTIEDGKYFSANGKASADFYGRVIQPAIDHCTKQWWQVWK